MTDDDRLLEIATRIAENSTEQCGGRTYLPPPEFCVKYAADLIAAARERTGAREERGQDVSVEMLQRAAVACRSAAAMWSAIPTKSEYWCETADYFDKRARAAGKGEG